MLTVDIWQLFCQCMWKRATILTSGSNAVSYAVVNFCRGSYTIQPPVYSGGKDWFLIESLSVLSDMFCSSLKMLSYYSFWQNFTLMYSRALCFHIIFSWYLPMESCVAFWCSYSSLQVRASVIPDSKAALYNNPAVQGSIFLFLMLTQWLR